MSRPIDNAIKRIKAFGYPELTEAARDELQDELNNNGGNVDEAIGILVACRLIDPTLGLSDFKPKALDTMLALLDSGDESLKTLVESAQAVLETVESEPAPAPEPEPTPEPAPVKKATPKAKAKAKAKFDRELLFALISSGVVTSPALLREFLAECVALESEFE